MLWRGPGLWEKETAPSRNCNNECDTHCKANLSTLLLAFSPEKVTPLDPVCSMMLALYNVGEPLLLGPRHEAGGVCPATTARGSGCGESWRHSCSQPSMEVGLNLLPTPVAHARSDLGCSEWCGSITHRVRSILCCDGTERWYPVTSANMYKSLF